MAERRKTGANGGKKKSPKSGGKKSSAVAARSWKRRALGSLLKLLIVAFVGLALWSLYLDIQVRERFEGKKWQIPAAVYAAPLELYAGAQLSLDVLVGELTALGYRKVSRNPALGQYSASASRVNFMPRHFDFPDEAVAAEGSGSTAPQALSVSFSGGSIAELETAAEGRPVSWFRLEPRKIAGIYPSTQEERTLVQLREVPDLLIQALLAVEDRDFRDHHGVAPLSIARAMLANLSAGKVVQGGSTLTQQLVKNFYLSSDRTLTRKLNEALMALLLELHYSKDDILETYINEIFLGQQGAYSIHGFATASRFYFAQPLNELQPHQLALLVGLVKGASYYNPRRSPARAKQRRDLVLKVLADQGLLSQAELVKWQGMPLGVRKEPGRITSAFPAFVDLVRQQLNEEYPEEVLQSEGLRIFTTLRPEVQQSAQNALSSTIKQKSAALKQPALQGAVIVTDKNSGEIVALTGDRSAEAIGFNRALQAERQVGSLLKPFVALTALEQQPTLSLASRVKDEAITLRFKDDSTWTPANFDSKSHGEVLLREAFVHSYNQAFVHLGLNVGLKPIIETLQRFGAKRKMNAYPSLILGAVNMTPLELTQMYQNLASGGFSTPMRSIRIVTDSDNKVRSRYPYQATRLVEDEVAYIIQYAMIDVVRSGTGRSVYSAFPDDYQVAGKTGTTNDLRDSWYVGFNGDYLATVWMGNDNNSSTGLTGSSGALQVWKTLYKDLPLTSLMPTKPDTVEWHWISPDGKLSAERCADSIPLPFRAQSVPVEEADCGDMGDAINRFWRRLVSPLTDE
ncbi:MAG: penicillin-binding protein 1B [unclassified Hahellaceae]|mgnify:CR=1 FL=1|nr:penicillin-binding protein 1B [Hahellaceae bacterium]|tara:strand:+ start:13212 stop:15608 length:2397 start_codon:yes stop_codon:yes gene_type:complete